MPVLSAEQQHVTGSGEEGQDQKEEWVGLPLGPPLSCCSGLPACCARATRASQECRRPFRLAEGRGLQGRGPRSWGTRGNPQLRESCLTLCKEAVIGLQGRETSIDRR